jgi:hypothetical protein
MFPLQSLVVSMSVVSLQPLQLTQQFQFCVPAHAAVLSMNTQSVRGIAAWPHQRAIAPPEYSVALLRAKMQFVALLAECET